jgi:homoserine/homoserine lactone efflux protein
MSQIIFLLLGLGILIDQFPGIFSIIKILGMLYLIVLGALQWFKKIEQISTSKDDFENSFSPLNSLLKGFFVNITNIKGTVFFLALIPLFVDLTSLNISTCVILTATLVGVDLFVMTGYLMLAEISKSLLSDPKKILWQNRVTGSILILIGLIMGMT